MAVCNQPHHVGGREVYRTVIFYREPSGEKVEGCRQCVDGMLTPIFSTDKRSVISQGTGKEYRISAAHKRHIRLRKLAPDGRTVYQNRRGNIT